MIEVIVVGAGPAGLSAALLLGRARRRTLVFDAGEPRNARARELHGFLTRDGTPPAQLLQEGREQLRRYPSVAIRDERVIDAAARPGRFEITTERGGEFVSRMLLLATGMEDRLPDLARMDEFYGTSVFHCPYCDGWEVQDEPLAVHGAAGYGLALELKQWSHDVMLLAQGDELPDRVHARLTSSGIHVEDRIATGLEGNGGKLERIRFSDGTAVDRRALFFKSIPRQRCPLPEQLGCEMTEQGQVKTGKFEVTSVPGLYVAGDASRNVQLAIVAASEGAQAAFAINTALLKADLPSVAS